MNRFRLNKHFKELLSICSVEHDNTYNGILAATQEKWLISDYPMHIEGTTYPLHAQERIKRLAKRLGYIEEVLPLKSFYDYAIILGGETLTMEPRFRYLDMLWQRGIHFGALVFQSGVHPMPLHDPYSDLTEAQVLRLLYHNARLAQKFPMTAQIFVDIPLQYVNSQVRHPTTEDGLKYWLSSAPQPGDCLVISSQPYIRYQNALFQAYMPSSFSVETVGPLCAKSIEVSEILDSVTRHLYACRRPTGDI